ncbi:MAG: alanine dehydrogenase [Gammaproteobacteria bacterium]|nr:alanine dehydrogenase [Gammaproteobacteria bacterium]
MKIGIPKEIKIKEGRVALAPDAAAELVNHGHQVLLEKSAGILSGYPDELYQKAGVTILADAASLYAEAEMIVKVKEPQPQEWPLLRSDHILFSYLHLAAEPALTKALQEIGLTAVAFETVEDKGQLPLLAPMSDIAGKIAVQVGSNLLHHTQGGRGLLLGGVPATERGNVVVIGAGMAGGNATRLAAAMGANVTVFDRSRAKLKQMCSVGNNVTGLHPFAHTIHDMACQADLLIGAVLIPGKKSPHLVSADTVREMKSGSVIVDISVDQGGCIETTRPTNYEEPTFVWEDVVHFGVTNMPGAVPRTASQSISAALVPYILRLTESDWRSAPDLAAGINVEGGKIVLPALI